MEVLEKLLECFRTAKDIGGKRFSELNAIRCLLGPYFQEGVSDTTLRERLKLANWTYDELHRFYETKTSNWAINPRETNEKNFSQLQSFLIENACDSQTFFESVTELFAIYISTKNVSFEIKMKKLISLSIWDTIDVAQLFTPYTHPKLTGYIPWIEKENELFDALQKNNLVFISGGPANGKTLLVKRVLKEHFHKSFDIYFTNKEQTSLDKIIKKISFMDKTVNFQNPSSRNFETALSYLKEKTEKSFFIIRKPFLEASDFEFIDQHLSGLKLKVIILTQTKNFDPKYHCVFIQDRPEDNLKKIYVSSRKQDDLSTQEWETLLDITSQNPYVLSLVGKSIQNAEKRDKCSKGKTNERDVLKEHLLNKTEWIWNLTSQPKLHKNFDDNISKSEQTLRNLLYYITESYGQSETYSVLSVWTKTPISKQLLIKISGLQDNDINRALQIGLLEYADINNSKIVMPAIIADIIWDENPISYTEYHENLIRFLIMLKSGKPLEIPYKTLYPVVRTMIQRFHFQVSTMASRDKPRDKYDFIEWNHTVINLLHHLIQLGDYEVAEEFLPYIFYHKYEKKNVQYNVATEDEQLLLSFINQDIQHMKSGVSVQSIDYLIDIMKEAQNIANKGNTSLYSSMYYAYLEIQAMLDYALRMEKLWTLEYSCTGTSKHLSSVDQLRKSISAYYMALSIFFDIQYVENYYRMIQAYINTIYTTDLNSYNSAIHFSTLCNSPDIPVDWRLRAQCQALFYSLVLIIKTTPPDTALTFGFYEDLYKNIYIQLSNKVFPWEVLWTFYSCTIIMWNCKTTLKPETVQNLEVSLLQLRSLAEQQITLPKEDRKYLLKLIDMISQN